MDSLEKPRNERHRLRAVGLKNWKIQDNDVSSKNTYDFKSNYSLINYDYYLTVTKCILKENEEIKATAYQFTVSKAQKETSRSKMPQAKFQ